MSTYFCGLSILYLLFISLFKPSEINLLKVKLKVYFPFIYVILHKYFSRLPQLNLLV